MNPSRREQSEAVPLIFNLSVAFLIGNAYPQSRKSQRSLRDGTRMGRVSRHFMPGYYHSSRRDTLGHPNTFTRRNARFIAT